MPPAAAGAESAHHSRRRYRRATLTLAVSLVAKGAALLALLASVPPSLAYLGSERFGLWMTALSAAGLLSIANLGLDKALLNALAAADGRGNRAAARRLVAAAMLPLAAILALLAIAFVTATPALPWAAMLNVPPTLAGDARAVMVVLVPCALLAALAGLVDTVQAAYQEGFLNSLWDAAGKLFGLLALLAAIAAGASLPVLALAFAGAPLIAALGNAGVLLLRRRPWLVPRPRLVQWTMVRRLFGAGGLFFLMQVALTIAYYGDNLIVAQLAGSAAAGSYAVTARLFDLPGMLLLLAGAAFWPSFAEALGRGDVAWTMLGLRRFVALSLALVLATALPLIPWGPAALRWWAGPEMAPPAAIFPAFAAFWIAAAVTQPLGVFLSAANALRFQLACTLALAGGGLVLKLILARTLGMAGVAWGRAGAEVVFVLLPYLLFLPHLRRRLRRAGAGG